MGQGEKEAVRVFSWSIRAQNIALSPMGTQSPSWRLMAWVCIAFGWEPKATRNLHGALQGSVSYLGYSAGDLPGRGLARPVKASPYGCQEHPSQRYSESLARIVCRQDVERLCSPTPRWVFLSYWDLAFRSD
jgi:hypothetical protein